MQPLHEIVLAFLLTYAELFWFNVDWLYQSTLVGFGCDFLMQLTYPLPTLSLLSCQRKSLECAARQKKKERINEIILCVAGASGISRFFKKRKKTGSQWRKKWFFLSTNCCIPLLIGFSDRRPTTTAVDSQNNPNQLRQTVLVIKLLICHRVLPIGFHRKTGKDSLYISSTHTHCILHCNGRKQISDSTVHKIRVWVSLSDTFSCKNAHKLTRKRMRKRSWREKKRTTVHTHTQTETGEATHWDSYSDANTTSVTLSACARILAGCLAAWFVCRSGWASERATTNWKTGRATDLVRVCFVPK